MATTRRSKSLRAALLALSYWLWYGYGTYSHILTYTHKTYSTRYLNTVRLPVTTLIDDHQNNHHRHAATFGGPNWSRKKEKAQWHFVDLTYIDPRWWWWAYTNIYCQVRERWLVLCSKSILFRNVQNNLARTSNSPRGSRNSLIFLCTTSGETWESWRHKFNIRGQEAAPYTQRRRYRCWWSSYSTP